MSIRAVCGATAASVLTLGMVAFAQTNQPSQTSAQANRQSESPITLVGCIQREVDYRRAHDSGRGGVAATGAGLGNEFVLVNASPGGTSSAANAATDCSTASGGEAYELTGSRERDLERFVGRRVELNGMLKRAGTAVGTSGATARPSGGFDPLGQDLRLHEVNVTSFREVAATPEAGTPAQEVRSEPAAPVQRQREAAGTVSPQIELPRTASPLPLAGLAGLLALGGAAGIRSYRRRTR